MAENISKSLKRHVFWLKKLKNRVFGALNKLKKKSSPQKERGKPDPSKFDEC